MLLEMITSPCWGICHWSLMQWWAGYLVTLPPGHIIQCYNTTAAWEHFLLQRKIAQHRWITARISDTPTQPVWNTDAVQLHSGNVNSELPITPLPLLRPFIALISIQIPCCQLSCCSVTHTWLVVLLSPITSCRDSWKDLVISTSASALSLSLAGDWTLYHRHPTNL